MSCVLRIEGLEEDIDIIPESSGRTPGNPAIMTKENAWIGERGVANDVIPWPMQPNAVRVGRHEPAELRTIEHDRFCIPRLIPADDPHIAVRLKAGRSRLPKLGKLTKERLAVAIFGLISTAPLRHLARGVPAWVDVRHNEEDCRSACLVVTRRRI